MVADFKQTYPDSRQLGELTALQAEVGRRRHDHYADRMRVRGHGPRLVLEVSVEEVFSHCSKAFLRSKTWEPETWNPGAAPRRAVIAQALERPDETVEALEEYYGPSYAGKIYG